MMKMGAPRVEKLTSRRRKRGSRREARPCARVVLVIVAVVVLIAIAVPVFFVFIHFPVFFAFGAVCSAIRR
jgi:protein-S-isoprenylcysteine O-methyltransferase Ste14